LKGTIRSVVSSTSIVRVKASVFNFPFSNISDLSLPSIISNAFSPLGVIPTKPWSGERGGEGVKKKGRKEERLREPQEAFSHIICVPPYLGDVSKGRRSFKDVGINPMFS